MTISQAVRFEGGPLDGVECGRMRGALPTFIGANGRAVHQPDLVPWGGMAGAAHYERTGEGGVCALNGSRTVVAVFTVYGWCERQGLPINPVERGAALLRTFLIDWEPCEPRQGMPVMNVIEELAASLGYDVHPRQFQASMLWLNRDYQTSRHLDAEGRYVTMFPYRRVQVAS